MYKWKFSSKLFVVTLFANYAALAVPQLDNPILPVDSVATTEDTVSLFNNPAGLSHHPNQFSFFYGWLGDNTSNSFSSIAAFSFLTLGYDSMDFYDATLNKNVDLKRFSLAYSSYIYKPIFSWGFNNTWFFSDNSTYDNLSNLSFGLQARPFRILAAGLSFKNINQPAYNGKDLETRVIAGLALRPLGKFITLAADFELLGYNAQDQIPIQLSVKTILPMNVFVHSKYELQSKDFTINIGWEAQNLRMQYATSTNNFNNNIKNNQLQNHLLGLTFSNETFSNRTFGKKYLEIVFNEEIKERKTDSFLFPSKSYTVYELVNGIDQAAEDPGIKGILLKIENARGGFGKIQEIRNALIRFKKKGKKIIAFSASPGNREYYLASVANHIVVPESGTVSIIGLKAELFFFKDLLEKIGVEADFIAVGEYKSAMEMFMKKEPSAANREAIQSLLGSLSSSLIRDIAKARKLSENKVKELIDIGFISAQRAKNEKLIDGNMFYTDLKKEISEGDPKKKKLKFEAGDLISARGYFNRKLYIRDWGPRTTIAILHIGGAIVSGKSDSGGIFSEFTTGADTIEETVDWIAGQSNIEGIILRVDSPGGSGLASDIIWNSLKKLKKKKKKIYVSFSDVAASGGYYVACAGDAIFANEGTITGSIGVFGGKFSLKGLYQKLGINKTIIRQAKHAAIFTEADRFTDSERLLMREHLKEFYELFLKRVSTSRNKTRDETHKIAKGRVWTGSQAKKNGLVDHIGGLALALEMMKTALKIPPKYPVQIIHLPEQSEFQFINASDIAKTLGFNEDLRRAAQLTLQQSKFKDNEVLFLLPYKLDVK